MRYMLLIYDDPKVWAGLSQAEQGQIMGEYRTLVEDLTAKGQYVSGAQLMPTTSATSVQVRKGKRLVTDGPFAETREQLGGYFLVEVADLDAALAIAERIPSAKLGTIEVRPQATMPARAQAPAPV
jgi:hypothetical protein